MDNAKNDFDFTYVDPSGTIKFSFRDRPFATLPPGRSWTPTARQPGDVTLLPQDPDLDTTPVSFNKQSIETAGGKTLAGNWDITPPGIGFQGTVLAKPANDKVTEKSFTEELKRWSTVWTQTFITRIQRDKTPKNAGLPMNRLKELGSIEAMTAEYSRPNETNDGRVVVAKAKTLCRWEHLRDSPDIALEKNRCPFDEPESNRTDGVYSHSTPTYDSSFHPRRVFPVTIQPDGRPEFAMSTARLSRISGNEHFVTHLVLFRAPTSSADHSLQNPGPAFDDKDKPRLQEACLVPLAVLNWAAKHEWAFTLAKPESGDDAKTDMGEEPHGATIENTNKISKITSFPPPPTAESNRANLWIFSGDELRAYFGFPTNPSIQLFPEIRPDITTRTRLFYSVRKEPWDEKHGEEKRKRLPAVLYRDDSPQGISQPTRFRLVSVDETNPPAALYQPNPLQPHPPLRFGLEFEFKLELKEVDSDLGKQILSKFKKDAVDEYPKAVTEYEKLLEEWKAKRKAEKEAREAKKKAKKEAERDERRAAGEDSNSDEDSDFDEESDDTSDPNKPTILEKEDFWATHIHQKVADYLVIDLKGVPECVNKFANDGPTDYTKWSITDDSHLDMKWAEITAPKPIFSFEFVSPVIDYNIYSMNSMYNAYDSVARIFGLVEKHFRILKFVDKTSTHVNISPRYGWSLEQVQRLASSAYFWEPYVRYLVPPHRRVRDMARDLRCAGFRFRLPVRLPTVADMTEKKKDLEPLFFPQTEHEKKTDAEPFLKCTWDDVFGNINDIQKEKNSVEKALERFQPSRWWKETAWNAKTIREGRLKDAAGRMEFRRPPGCVTRWEALAWLDFCMAFTYAALAKGSEDDLRALKDKYIDQLEGLSMGVFKGWIDSYRMLPKTPMRNFLDAKFRRAAEEVKLRSSEKTESATTGGSEITFPGSEDKIEVSAKGGLYLTPAEEARLIKVREELKLALDEQPVTDDEGSARDRKFEKGWTDDMEKGWEVGMEFETRTNDNAEAGTIEDLKKAKEIADKEVEGFDWQVYWDNLRATPAPSTGQ